MTRPTIVFDLDGTLIDTAPDLLDSLNHSLEAGGLARAEAAALKGFIGYGGKVMIEKAYAAQQKALATEEHDRLYALFVEHYNGAMPGRSLPYPGVIEALDRFEAAGYIMAVCTNKFEAMAVRLLTALGMAHRFVTITGQDTFAFRKPDPRHLLETIAKAGGDPANAVMVGDSRTDIDTAKAAGVPVVAVDFGYTERHVREFEPSVIISHFEELTLDLARRLVPAPV
jgi:phosphoglycolate phosphatase